MPDLMDDARKAGMASVARAVIGKALPPSMVMSRAAAFRAGEFDAAAVILDAAGDSAGAVSMSAMSAAWLKIAQDV